MKQVSPRPLKLQLLEAEHPRGVTKEPILWLHRHDDGIVAFMKSDEAGNFSNLASVTISELRSQPFLPKILGGVSTDVFVSVNAFYRKATRYVSDLRYLNAAFVDMDFYVKETDGSIKPALQWGEAVGLLLKLAEEGVIPPPSIYVRSGNGAWILWLLVGEDGAPHQGAFTEKRNWLASIQSAMRHRIQTAAAELKPDPRAADLSRVMRVPGSYSTKAHRQVVWLGAFDAQGELPSYSLKELGSFAEVPERKLRPLAPPKNEQKKRSTATGWRAMWEQRLTDLIQLAEHRRGFREGCRNSAMLVRAVCLARLGMSPEDLQKDIEGEGRRNCYPPLTDREIAGAVLSATRENGKTRRRGYTYRNRTIAEHLEVTQAEADRLGLKQIRPDFLDQYETRYGVSYADSPKRGNRTAARPIRREHIQQMVSAALAGAGRVPPLRTLQMMLGTVGIKASLETIRQDLLKLGLHSKSIQSRQMLLAPDDDSSPVN